MKNSTRQRNALILKITDSPFFEEAHLILKEDAAADTQNDMVKEAVRIISSCRPHTQKRKNDHPRSPLFYFVCGLFCSPLLLVAGCGILFLLSRLS